MSYDTFSGLSFKAERGACLTDGVLKTKYMYFMLIGDCFYNYIQTKSILNSSEWTCFKI